MARARRIKGRGEQPDQDMIDNLERDGTTDYDTNGNPVPVAPVPPPPTTRRKPSRGAPSGAPARSEG